VLKNFSLSLPRLAFLARVDFHARSRFARSTIPEEKMGITRSLIEIRTKNICFCFYLALSFVGIQAVAIGHQVLRQPNLPQYLRKECKSKNSSIC